MSIDLHYFTIGKARFEKILDFLPYPFLISDLRNGTYVNLYLNQKFIQEIGYTIEAIPTIDEWFLKAYPDENHRNQVIEKWNEGFSKAKEEGRDFVLMKVLIRTKKNGSRWYEVKASLLEQMQMVAFVDVHLETMREKELELENRNHNITLSILSHDLRSPISNLKSLIELVSRNQISDEQFKDMTKKLNERSQQVLDLLDTTLLWTKANFDGLMIKKETVDIRSIVGEILTLYDNVCHSKKLIITWDIVPSALISDEEIIKIILRNLISNAIKFTPLGGTIRIRAFTAEDHFVLSVNDSGSGFDTKLLEDFVSNRLALNHDLRRGHGHGIGLTLCRLLIEKINGTMQITSKPNQGTLVNVIIKKS